MVVDYFGGGGMIYKIINYNWERELCTIVRIEKPTIGGGRLIAAVAVCDGVG